MDLNRIVRVVPDFPKPGISFKDITPILQDPDALRFAVDQMASHFRDRAVDVVLGVESRGFIFGAPIAYTLGRGFVLARKPGKLPAAVVRVEYGLEYGRDALEVHTDAISPGQRVLLVDDLLATGGTITAAAKLVQQLGGVVAGYAFLIELTALGGRKHLPKAELLSLLAYDD
ncbi:MAG TPA: adenine phosphoribosyltransferase [Limnochordia bacterium]|nr:adenine phosphoribosyltransferase [Limnochordia bacterium]